MKLSGDLQNDKEFGSKVVLPGYGFGNAWGLILSKFLIRILESIVIQGAGQDLQLQQEVLEIFEVVW
jgi:hypothetical protein